MSKNHRKCRETVKKHSKKRQNYQKIVKKQQNIFSNRQQYRENKTNKNVKKLS